jgi:hypothetical protein
MKDHGIIQSGGRHCWLCKLWAEVHSSVHIFIGEKRCVSALNDDILPVTLNSSFQYNMNALHWQI